MQLFPVAAPASGDFTLAWSQVVLVGKGDSALIEASTDRGATWRFLARYDSTMAAPWRDGVLGPDDWIPANVALASFDGDTVIVRYRLAMGLRARTGWFIDDVHIGAFPVGVREEEARGPGFVRVFPQPATARLFVESIGESGISVRMLDCLGRFVWPISERDGSAIYDTASLPAGPYSLWLATPAGIRRKTVMVLH
jgi:hypothetical protein